MANGFGSITWWGFSPALDLQNQDVNTALSDMRLIDSKEPKDVHMLLIGAGDVRHMLCTLSRAHRYPEKKLHFYILETSLELYARNLLFLAMSLEAQNRMGLQEKTEMFMELFGNILIRQQTCEYMEKMSTEFIRMVTDANYLEKKLPLIDLSQLKFKERDFLEGIFKFWRNPDVKLFDAHTCWDLRMRQLLGSRYDSGRNAFDWDYHMKLAERGADIINKHEYINWRQNGVAYEVRDGTYDVPNKTLASGAVFKHGGERFARRGFWGDIIVSPFVSLATECEEKSFFKKTNGVYMKTSQHITEYNVTAMLHELTTHTPYVLPKEDAKPIVEETPKLQEITEEEEDEEVVEEVETSELSEDTDPEINPLDLPYDPVIIDNVKITFLPIGSLPDIVKKTKYKAMFDLVYFSNSMVHLLTDDIAAVFADKASVVLETARFMLELNKEQLHQFVERITGMAHAAGCKATHDCDGVKDSFAKFTFTRS